MKKIHLLFLATLFLSSNLFCSKAGKSFVRFFSLLFCCCSSKKEAESPHSEHYLPIGDRDKKEDAAKPGQLYTPVRFLPRSSPLEVPGPVGPVNLFLEGSECSSLESNGWGWYPTSDSD